MVGGTSTLGAVLVERITKRGLQTQGAQEWEALRNIRTPQWEDMAGDQAEPYCLTNPIYHVSPKISTGSNPKV